MRIFGYLVPFRFMPGSWGLNGDTYDLAEADYSLTGEALARRKAAILHKNDESALRIANANLDLQYGKITAYEHDVLIADVRYPADSKERSRALLDIVYRHGKMSDHEYDRKVLSLDYEEGSPELEKALLDVDYQHGVIGEKAYEKAAATLNGDPWVGVLNSEFTSSGEGIGAFALELDWNEKFIEYLRENGYTGEHDADIVDRWLADINAASAPDEEVMTLPLAGRRPYPIR
jgi:hypothetical protein